MNPPTMPVFVRMEKRALANRWVSHEWQVVGIEAQAAANAGAARTEGPFDVSLFRDEAEGYFLNTSSGNPKAFVMWRVADSGPDEDPAVKFVTLSYNEAARLMDAQERVDAVDLPSPMRAWLEAYVAANYRPEQKKKRVKASFVAPGDKAGL